MLLVILLFVILLFCKYTCRELASLAADDWGCERSSFTFFLPGFQYGLNYIQMFVTCLQNWVSTKGFRNKRLRSLLTKIPKVAGSIPG